MTQQPSISSYLPLNLSVGTREEDAINVSNLNEATTHASDEDYVIYVHDCDERLLFTLNCYGQPNETLGTIDSLIFDYIRDAEGDTDDLSILDQPNPEARARNEYRKSLKLTTDHSASSYDIPVLVGNDNIAYGISDFVELLHNSARNLARALYEDGDTDLDTYCRFTQSDPNYKGDIDDLIA